MWKMEAAIYPNQENGGMYHTVIVVHNSKKWWELYYDRDGWSKLDLQPLASGLHFCYTLLHSAFWFSSVSELKQSTVYADICKDRWQSMLIYAYMHIYT